MLELTIRDMRLAEADEVSDLIMRSFVEFIAPDYDEEGRTNFTAFAQPHKLAERHRSDHFTLVAECGAKIVGMVQVQRPSHLLMLFVDKRFHRSGVARRLLEASTDRIQSEQPEVGLITVYSSPFAVDIYARLGFAVAGAEDRTGGVLAVPMVKRLA